MANLRFHPDHQINVPTLVLQSRSGESYGAVGGVSDLTYKKNLNSANELSFTASRYIDGILNPLWEYLTDLKNIYIPEFQEKFEIKVSCNDSGQETKSITAASLCEAELGQVILRGLEINTENDLNANAAEDYPVTVFYREISDFDDEITKIQKKKHSLLHRILSEKAPSYRIGHVDDSLKDLSFEFTADGTSIYDFLTGDVAEKMQCLFLFDSMTRTIHVRDLCSTCKDCYDEVIGVPRKDQKHYRGDFHHVCPNCHSHNISEGYGKDTSILIHRDNLASSLSREGDADSLKNCFYVEGGDETINAAFAQLNPNGSQYIYYFSPETLADMPEYLQDALKQYDDLYNEYLLGHSIDTKATAHEYRRLEGKDPHMVPAVFDPNAPDCIPDSTYAAAFNTVLSEISSLSEKKPYTDYNYQVPFTFVGQSDLVTHYYNAIDLQVFLEHQMMPTYEMETYDKYEALARLNAASFGTVAVSGLNDSNAIKSSIENVILHKAKTLINTALFSVDIAESSSAVSLKSQSADGRKTYTGTWTGTFSITDRQNDDDRTNTITNSNYAEIAQREGREIPTNISARVAIPLNDDVITYAKNSISYMISKKDLPTAADIYLPDVSSQDFGGEAALHSRDDLLIFQNVLTDCLGIITSQLETMTQDAGSADSLTSSELYSKMATYQKNYQTKLTKVSDLLSQRNKQISAVNHFLLLMQTYLEEVTTALNFKNYLASYEEAHHLTQDLWEIFHCYRREGEYRNENIISDNLKSNADIVTYAGWLMNYAKKELAAAGTMQYRISTTLNNLLALPEFEPLLEDFDVGNWIRVHMNSEKDNGDDLIYKLRLLSYQINFDAEKSSEINVEFSTVTHACGVMSDAESILKSAKSMAKSYHSITRQVELSSETTRTVNHWVADGLDMTNQMIVNDANRQSLVIDQHGLLARKYDDLTDLYDDCQLKIFNNGLYLTKDNWENLEVGIGKIAYTDPDTQHTVIDYGINARKIIGEMILGETLGIYNTSGSMRFDENGFVVSNGKDTVTINPNNQEKLFKITNSSKEDILFIDNEGRLNSIGIITTTGGNIGGFTIGDTFLSNNTTSLGTDADSVYIGTDGISCGKNFIANKNGMINITGNIYIHDALYLYRKTQDDTMIVKEEYAKTFEYCGISEEGTLTCYAPLDIRGELHTPYITCTGDIHSGGDITSSKTLQGATLKTTSLRLKPGGYTTTAHINCPWKDGAIHDALLLSNDGLSLSLGWAGSDEYTTTTVLRGSSVRLKNTSGTVVSSDERLKNSFKTMEEYEGFFDSLKPYFFKLNDGTSGRYHGGFKAQQIMTALAENDLTTQDFAGFVKYSVNPDSEEYRGYEEEYGLIYTEFVALNTHMIQKTRNELKQATEKIAELEHTLEKLQQITKY